MSESDRATVATLVLAAGSGVRLGTERPKQFLPIDPDGSPEGPTVLDLLLEAYDKEPRISEIVVVCHPTYVEFVTQLAARYRRPNIVIVGGGATRHDSVQLGLEAIRADVTLIHDAARPILHPPALEECLERLDAGARGVVTTFHPVASMLVTRRGEPVVGVMERDEIAFGMCPVAYYTTDLVAAFREAASDGVEFRDEPALMRALRPDVVVETVTGHQSGFKLTFPEDMEILRAYLRHLPGAP